MTPEEQHQDAVAAAREWRDEQRAEAEKRGRLVWIDSGSGPGYMAVDVRRARCEEGPSERPAR